MNFKVLIIGSDINAYYMARCYHELYHNKVDMICKSRMGFTYYSNITNIMIEPDLWISDKFVEILEKYANENNYKQNKILLIATNDFYVRLIVENEEVLKKYFSFNYPRIDIINNLLIKENFYLAYKDSSLELPKTVIYKCLSEDKIPEWNEFPMIVKPGDGFLYHKHEFEGMRKVYKIYSNDELKKSIQEIEDSGYDGNLVLQEFIPGGDDALFDSIFYCNTQGKAELMTFAQIALQERTKTAIGNCTVLVNGYDEHGYKEELINKLKDFLESINYTGFAEFDIKYDSRDNKYKVLEINPRQARSSYYLAFCGYNLVKYLIDDVIFNKRHDLVLIKEQMVLSFVPKAVIKKYVDNKILSEKIFSLIKQNKYVNPLKYKDDKNFTRKLFLLYRDFNYLRKYKNNKF